MLRSSDLAHAVCARRSRVAVLAIVALVPRRRRAQTAAEHIALGDRDHAAMNAAGALQHYEAAIKLDPKIYEALWKASREAVDVGEFDADAKERDALYTLANNTRAAPSRRTRTTPKGTSTSRARSAARRSRSASATR